MMATAKVIAALAWISLLGIPRRLGASSVILVSLGGLAAVVVCLLGLADSLSRSVTASGRPDRALVLRTGAETERLSTLTRDNVITLLNGPGIAKAADGTPFASAEVLENAASSAKGTGATVNLLLRGVGAHGLDIRPELRVVEGRRFQPGTPELIVGRSVRDRFAGLQIGDRVRLGATDWTVVGTFETGGDTHESELMADADSVLSAYRHTAFNSLTVKLDSDAGLAAFTDWATGNPGLAVGVERESYYFARQSQRLSRYLHFLTYGVGGIMAVGATVAALNAMYSAVAARKRAIATIRALGFGGGVVLASVIIEALVLAVAGSGIGAIAAWSFFNGYAVSTLNLGYTPLVFRISIDASLLSSAVGFALLVGVIGGLFPALRAARLPIATALRPE
jgi:putative ABC transport system permease protein